MIFNSLTFLLFLVLVVVMYWVLPKRPRLWLLFVASLTFYGFWRVEFIPVMMLSVVVDYLVSVAMPGKSPRQKKRLLWVSLVVNLGLLFYFKYLLFFAENAVGLANMAGIELDAVTWNIVLPLGISFYTFQTISYTVDVYRGTRQPERDFLLYACYVMFFPQLVAGPILRASEVIDQLRDRPPFDLSDLAIGVRRIIYGLVLKVALADNIAPYVDDGFVMEASILSALDVWTLAFMFGFQIYFDFAAYSHIAIGSARLMGIQFPENFDFPYLATSPRDFWKRWHISLSSWIRDYLYLPISGAKFQDRSTGGITTESIATNEVAQKKGRTYPLVLTWAIMGLWHGANWTFLLWGLYHAAMIVGYRMAQPLTKSLPQNVRTLGGIAITLPLMMLAWIPFRANSLADTFQMWKTVFIPQQYASIGMRENIYLIAAIVMAGILGTYVVQKYLQPVLNRHRIATLVGETLVFSVFIALVTVFLRPVNQFIYFQF
jgi:D-alanyl-lipoteichoic acid acyltransferase DltB (MBOAT superfamily)